MSITCFLYRRARAKEEGPAAWLAGRNSGLMGGLDQVAVVRCCCTWMFFEGRVRSPEGWDWSVRERQGLKMMHLAWAAESMELPLTEIGRLGRTGFGRKIRSLVWNKLDLSCPLSTQVRSLRFRGKICSLGHSLRILRVEDVQWIGSPGPGALHPGILHILIRTSGFCPRMQWNGVKPSASFRSYPHDSL